MYNVLVTERNKTMIEKVASELWEFSKSEARYIKREFNLSFLFGILLGIGILVGGFALLTMDTDKAKEMRKPSTEFSENHKVFYKFYTTCDGFFYIQICRTKTNTQNNRTPRCIRIGACFMLRNVCVFRSRLQ